MLRSWQDRIREPRGRQGLTSTVIRNPPFNFPAPGSRLTRSPRRRHSTFRLPVLHHSAFAAPGSRLTSSPRPPFSLPSSRLPAHQFSSIHAKSASPRSCVPPPPFDKTPWRQRMHQKLGTRKRSANANTERSEPSSSRGHRVEPGDTRAPPRVRFAFPVRLPVFLVPSYLRVLTCRNAGGSRSTNQ